LGTDIHSAPGPRSAISSRGSPERHPAVLQGSGRPILFTAPERLTSGSVRPRRSRSKSRLIPGYDAGALALRGQSVGRLARPRLRMATGCSVQRVPRNVLVPSARRVERRVGCDLCPGRGDGRLRGARCERLTGPQCRGGGGLAMIGHDDSAPARRCDGPARILSSRSWTAIPNSGRHATTSTAATMTTTRTTTSMVPSPLVAFPPSSSVPCGGPGRNGLRAKLAA
jgi:hypothetical protein